MQRNGKRLFTSAMASLLESGLSVKDSLDYIQSGAFSSRKDFKVCKDCARELSVYLDEGSLFSVAIKKCTSVRFDSVYIAFIASAEKTGNLENTFAFLKQKEEASFQKRSKIRAVCAYPLCVSVIAFIGSFILRALFYSTALGVFESTTVNGAEENMAYAHSSLWGLVCANLSLLSLLLLIFLTLRYFLHSSAAFDMFSIIAFLLEAGESLVSALRVSMLLAIHNEKREQKILEALSVLENGGTVQDAIGTQFPETRMYLALAEKNGSLSEAFSQIARYVQGRNEEREKIALSLLEPAIMLSLALYIIILLKTVIAPLLFIPGL